MEISWLKRWLCTSNNFWTSWGTAWTPVFIGGRKVPLSESISEVKNIFFGDLQI
jgi:hypothetical protein